MDATAGRGAGHLRIAGDFSFFRVQESDSKKKWGLHGADAPTMKLPEIHVINYFRFHRIASPDHRSERSATF
jgi:hypothetical protein